MQHVLLYDLCMLQSKQKFRVSLDMIAYFHSMLCFILKCQHCSSKHCTFVIYKCLFFNFSYRFLNPNFFPIWILCYSCFVYTQYLSKYFKRIYAGGCTVKTNSNYLQEEILKSILFQKLYWPFTVRINCSSDLKSFSQSIEQFFHTVCQNNFGNKIPILFICIQLFFLQKSNSRNIF